MKKQLHTFCVAPMMDWTDRHCRAFHRTLTRHALLYTEMVTADAVLRGDRRKLLGFDPIEQPVALQLGGSEPDKLAEAARIGEAFGYVEINLNVGCPSERVQSGAFGACLMREPALVADCLSAMREAVDVPVTVKHRIGVDDDDPRERLFSFVDILASAGTDVFIVHARKALLKGLSPKKNREIPPLDYALVEELKRARPDLKVVLNGGLASLDAAQRELRWADGVMLGRVAYHEPALLLDVDAQVFGMGEPVIGAPLERRLAAARDYRAYVMRALSEGVPLHAMTRHMLGLFAGLPGARRWRRHLSENAPGAFGATAIDVYDAALELLSGMAAVRLTA